MLLVDLVQANAGKPRMDFLAAGRNFQIPLASAALSLKTSRPNFRFAAPGYFFTPKRPACRYGFRFRTSWLKRWTPSNR
jgi:hypothetical protein